MRVLSWNLFHGRAQPSAGRPLEAEFATALAGWEWDVALLQEVPPWWTPRLAEACGAVGRTALTSRNAGLPLRRAAASRWPDLMRSNGGGSNAILVRGPWSIDAHGHRRLRWRPERRVVHAVRLGGPAGHPFDGTWMGNVHAQLGAWDDGPGLTEPVRDLRRSVAQLEAWAGEAHPLILGGDFNLPRQAVADTLPLRWIRCASNGPDHIVGRGVAADGDSSRPDRGALSDHAPLVVRLRNLGTSRADGV